MDLANDPTTGGKTNQGQDSKIQKKNISRDIKRSVRVDKKNFYETIADDLIAADANGNSRRVHNAVRKLTGTKAPNIDTVKDKNGKLITDTNDKIKQWANHFEQLLNRPTKNLATPQIRSQALSQINTDTPSLDEISLAIKKLKTNKAAGNDNIPPELFIHGQHELLPHLQRLLSLI